MRKILLTLIINSFFIIASGQKVNEEETSAIVAEGKSLYRSELASWYGTDIFLEKFSGKRSDILGYFSYEDYNRTKCIFFSKGDHSKVVVSISFDSIFNINTAVCDSTIREFTSHENDLFTIRQKARDQINTDTLFRTYNNTELNLIPLIANGEKKVYVLTGPKVDGVVVFGNDYLLTFDRNNNIVNKKKIHNNILITEYGQKEGQSTTGGFHSHIASTGDYITPTDICTLMLYGKTAKWEQYYVLSKKFVCIWDCHKDQLITLTKEAWDKISKDKPMN